MLDRIRQSPSQILQFLNIILKAWQGPEQLHLDRVTAKSGVIPADETGMEPRSRGDVFGHLFYRNGKEKSSNGFA